MSHLGPTPRPGRALVRGERLAETLLELERKVVGVAIQGSVSRWGEVSLLAFDPTGERGRRGSLRRYGRRAGAGSRPLLGAPVEVSAGKSGMLSPLKV